jgi:hypothetical protein
VGTVYRERGMTVDDTNLALELLRGIDAKIDEMRSDIRDMAASMSRSIETLERINSGPRKHDVLDVSL